MNRRDLGAAFLLLFSIPVFSWSARAQGIGPAAIGAPREEALQHALQQAKELLKEKTSSSLSPAGTAPISKVTMVETLIIPLNTSSTITGSDITRLMTTESGIVSAQLETPSRVTVTGQSIGTTFLHLWDQGQRRSFKVKVTRRALQREVGRLGKPAEKKGEQAEPFKLSYQLEHNSFYRANSTSGLNRSNLNVAHQFEGGGTSPYGDLSYKTTVRRRAEDHDVSDYTLKLEEGKIGQIEDFDLTLFDTRLPAQGFVLPATRLRGAHWTQELDTLGYDLFWGEERVGTFGSLSLGFDQDKESNLGGFQLRKQFDAGLLKWTYGHGYGDDRRDELQNNVTGFDWESVKAIRQWKGSLGLDGDHYGFRMENQWDLSPWKLTTAYRDVERNYFTLLGSPSFHGERGVLFSANFDPGRDFHLGGSFDLYRNRLFPNPAEPGALNQRVQLDFSTRFWEVYTFRSYLSNSRLLGSLSPSEYFNYSAYLGRPFRLWNWDLNPYLRYYFRDNDHRSTPATDFESHTVTGGGNLRLTKNFSFNLSQEWSFVDETGVNVQTHPRAFTTGFDYKIPLPEKIPVRANYGLRYRNEENTESPRSFLTGEDTLTHRLNLTYDLSQDVQLFFNGSLDYIHFENSSPRQVEGDFFLGLRSSFDTPLRWNPRAPVVGVVFEDLNGNGWHDSGENGIPGIRLSCNGKPGDETDNEGYYLLENVTGKTALISFDMTSLPAGYVITGVSEKEIEIIQGEPVMVNFALLSVSQVRGFLFNDLDSDREFDLSDLGISDIVLWLDNRLAAKTDRYGHFTFGKVDAGVHSVRVDINSLPHQYLSDVPLQQEITLGKNESFELFFPMKTIRLVAGKVFHDANQNGKPDKGEKGIGGVAVGFDNVSILTDAEGNYLLENLPVGSVTVSVREESLPKPYRLTDPRERTIQILPEGTLQQDVNFPAK